MKLNFIDYIVESETNNDDGTFTTILTCRYKLDGDINNLFGIQTAQLTLIQSNSLTGFEMDEERLKLSTDYVNSFNS